MKTISVIASKCTGSGDSLRVYGDRERDATFRESDKDAAFDFGNSLRAEGMSVIVRPNYNHDDGLGYDEWRSFNGEPFKEVVFRVGT